MQAGGGQFASNPTPGGEGNETNGAILHNKQLADNEKEEREDLRDLGVELDGLETAQRGGTLSPLLHIDLKHSRPLTPTAAAAKKKRGLCVCGV